MARDEVEFVCSQAMTVGQLRAALEGLDSEAPVMFVCDYGDYHSTQQALPCSDVEEFESSDLQSSGYSHSGVALVEDDCDGSFRDGAEEDSVPVVIIRS